MKCSKVLFILAMLMALVISLSATPNQEKLSLDDDEEDVSTSEAADIPYSESQELAFLGGTSRFLAQKSRVPMTCNKHPRICRVKGSRGPNCCKKKCVNVMTDRLNCGICGNKCNYSDICCKGKCVNPGSDKKHCGTCSNKCKKGTLCVYGMCSYA